MEDLSNEIRAKQAKIDEITETNKKKSSVNYSKEVQKSSENKSPERAQQQLEETKQIEHVEQQQEESKGGDERKQQQKAGATDGVSNKKYEEELKEQKPVQRSEETALPDVAVQNSSKPPIESIR